MNQSSDARHGNLKLRLQRVSCRYCAEHLLDFAQVLKRNISAYDGAHALPRRRLGEKLDHDIGGCQRLLLQALLDVTNRPLWQLVLVVDDLVGASLEHIQ